MEMFEDLLTHSKNYKLTIEYKSIDGVYADKAEQYEVVRQALSKKIQVGNLSQVFDYVLLVHVDNV